MFFSRGSWDESIDVDYIKLFEAAHGSSRQLDLGTAKATFVRTTQPEILCREAALLPVASATNFKHRFVHSGLEACLCILECSPRPQ